ncbi:MAG: radical SAM protein [Planctomycetales bacterium]|nr:radical SAM protein [Planctomycetales bacterium]
MIELANLEFHAAHACNLFCAQCSHYSNFHAGGLVSLDEANANFSAWKDRLAPKRIVILGGEPTLNPELLTIIELARESFPNAEGLFVTNGFFLDRHPDLPRVLIDNRFRMDVSEHGRAPEYMKRFRLVRQQLRQWRAAYPELQINIRKSHRGWRQQYRMVDGKPMPFCSDPKAAWKICLQRTCTQLNQSCLWKCPALAYHAIMSRKLRLDDEPAWQLFRDYQACPPTASDEQVRTFFATEEIKQCSLCPARKIHFRHANPISIVSSGKTSDTQGSSITQ